MLGVFRDFIGRTIEAYIDDIMVKSRKDNDLITDLDAAFRCLKKKNIKLNPEKCVFGVPRGMFLGFIIFGQDFTDEVDWPLDQERMPLLLSLDDDGRANHLVGHRDV
jgi:hypothetical protein